MSAITEKTILEQNNGPYALDKIFKGPRYVHFLHPHLKSSK